MDKILEQEIRQILTETGRGEIHAATASILTLIAAARPADVSDGVVPDVKQAIRDAYIAGCVSVAEFAELPTDDFGEPADDYAASVMPALALLPGGVPDGYVLVPREPTDEMMGAGDSLAVPDEGYYPGAGPVYIAMLSASPKGSSRSLPSRTTQEPQSPTPCDLEGK